MFRAWFDLILLLPAVFFVNMGIPVMGGLGFTMIFTLAIMPALQATLFAIGEPGSTARDAVQADAPASA
jgi:hypothetical protein